MTSQAKLTQEEVVNVLDAVRHGCAGAYSDKLEIICDLALSALSSQPVAGEADGRKANALYRRASSLMAYLGAYGEVSPKSSLADALMNALNDIDGGNYNDSTFLFSAPPAPEAGKRVLFDSDPFCPKCGHNRDRSSISSISDLSKGTHYCQLCQADWREIDTAPAEVDGQNAAQEPVIYTEKDVVAIAEMAMAAQRLCGDPRDSIGPQGYVSAAPATPPAATEQAQFRPCVTPTNAPSKPQPASPKPSA